MATRLFLLWVGICFAVLCTTEVGTCPIGREFMTAFMINYKTSYGTAKPQLAITAMESTATVTIGIQGLNFKQSLTIGKGVTKYVTLPKQAEIAQDAVSAKTVLITSDKDISVVSSHIKLHTGDSSVVLPSHQLGKTHVVFTPEGLYLHVMVAIVNGKKKNKITILPYSNIQLKNKMHLKKGYKTYITLKPHQVYLLRSKKTLSGTRIESEHPVAVLGGHECLSFLGSCEHVYEQLIPVESLANEYLVPNMHPLKKDTDFANIVATEDKTDVTIFNGHQKHKKTLHSGQYINVPVVNPTVIRSNKKIMVMYSSTNWPFDEFFTNLIPVSEMSNSWTVYSQKGYTNFMLVVSETEGSKSLTGMTWTVFPSNHKYSWAIKSVNANKGPLTITSNSQLAVYIFGGKTASGFGTTGVCRAPSVPPTPTDPCESVKCGLRQECKKGVCVDVKTATCRAIGDPHYATLDGKRYDFQGTCTYTMATTIKTENGLVPFTVLAKNNRRWSKLVSYVRTVSLSVYNHTIVASKQRGVVEVDGEITYLPVSLAQGKVEAVQRGLNVLITTEFGLEVKYDWNMMLYITVPSTYSRSLGGLCGNYNGDRSDELSGPNGKKLSSILEFAKSWKVPDNDLFCYDNCVGHCPFCHPKLKENYARVKFCGLISQKNGPFAKCHKIVDPSTYIDNCVYDVCINKGIRSFLCENIRSYAEDCREAGVTIDSKWRMLSKCPLKCPVNSHYEFCGTACPATCVNPKGPKICTKICVEGCQCNKGFVLSGDKCVPVSKCGCSFNNRYYPSGVKFWDGQSCTKKCKCKSGKVKCVSTKCKASEVCRIQDGVRDCYPQSYGHCRGSGDPHYGSLDGKFFDFQGTCTYYLSKLVNTAENSLVPFEVLVKNENRGRNKAVSFTKTVEVNVFGYSIILSKDNFGKVKVNNLLVNLPFETEGGELFIFRSGSFGVVKTYFGMKVIFNWRSYVQLTLPSTYRNQVEGLCGNWNGNKKDDLAFPNNTITKNPTAFGDSWKARNDPGCSSECEGQKCPKCDTAERNKPIFQNPCKRITDVNGPFKACHSKVDPTKFYEDCVYDMCMYGGHSTALCNALTVYTAECQAALSIVKNWRTKSFCPASCKANSHYDVCGAGCPHTCKGLTEPTGCKNEPCIEGCICDDGFVLSNDDCVPVEQCGCEYEGQYYNLGQVFFPKGKCKERCVCNDDGEVTCNNNFSCSPNEKCVIHDGVQACHPDGKGSCSICGSGTYRSYDGNNFDVQGDCEYTLVETVKTLDEQKIPFSVTVQQVSSAVVVTRRINIEVHDYKIALLPGLPWEIRVDGVKAVLPVTLEEGLVKVYQIGAFIILETSFGLKVTYDTVSVATVEIPSTYKNAVQGLCGNYNNKKNDDFKMPSGKMALTAEIFVKSWKVIMEDMTCHTGCPSGLNCSSPTSSGQTEDNECKIIVLKTGPFSNCHSKVQPSPFYDTCVKETASQSEDETLVCRHIQSYVARCQQAGVSISTWRNSTFCPMTCPVKSHYEICADTCTSTCASLTETLSCPECLEGCQCDEGFVFDGGNCKPIDDCGCLVEGRYYKSGESVLLGDCTEKCTCKAGVFTCQLMTCEEDEVCRIPNGIPTCIHDPCDKKKCREKEQCVEKDNAAVCVPESEATCKIIGDPFYETFDGSRFSFQGTCSYTMVKTSGKDKSLTDFSIVNKNELAETRTGTYIKKVTIKVLGHDITIVENDLGKVTIDAKEAVLPVSLESGRINITQSGIHGFLKTKFGLAVMFDWGETIKVTVSSNYFGNLVGMCGSYNDNPDDDFVTPQGIVVKDNTEWGKSWSIPDNDTNCWHFPPCTEEKKLLYNSPKFCGLLEDKTGPFANCNSTIQYGQLTYSCLFRTCLTDGNHDAYCKLMTAYANTCNWEETDVSPQWKQIAKCG